MNRGKTLRELRAAVAQARAEGKQIGFVPTVGNLHAGHVSLVEIAAQRAEKYLKELRLWDKAFHQSREMSGGMKRRVLIAKALSHDPTVLFLDEPTAGLSPKYMEQIFQICRDVRETGVAILLVEQHAKQALAFADRGYVLAAGQNRHEGTGAELLADREVAEMFLGG